MIYKMNILMTFNLKNNNISNSKIIHKVKYTNIKKIANQMIWMMIL